MDFVVAGLGFGALVVVVGFIIRDLGPLLWKRFAGSSIGSQEDDRWRWRGFCLAISGTLTVAGAAILLVTVISVFAGASDSQGEIAVGVVAILAVAGGFFRGALQLRDYRHGRIEAAPDPNWRPQPESTQRVRLSTGAAGAVSSVRRVRRPEQAEESTTATSTERAAVLKAEPESLLDEPFDVTRLLPSEFDEEYDESDESSRPTTSVAVSAEVPLDRPVRTGVTALETTIEVVESEAEEAEPATAESPKKSNSATLPGHFKSSLLADIGIEPPTKADQAGAFASSLLADVDKDAVAGEQNYQSPLLSDLQPEGEETETQAGDHDPTAVEAAADEMAGEDGTDTVIDVRPVGATRRD